MRLLPLLVVVGLVGAAGCGTRASKGTTGPAAKAAEDPWPAAVTALRKESTPGGLARVLGELSAAAGGDAKFAPEAVPPSAEAALKDLARLTDDDLKAIRPAGYSALDPHYLAECLYLRDIARTLDATGLPPDQKARRAFDWVCRQVVLAPASLPGRGVFPPAPPTLVLRRGAGSGLERAYVLLALGQQVGVNFALIGPADAADKTWQFDPAPQPNQPPRGPFWAVGVPTGGGVLLFDPWRNVPFTKPDNPAPVTLAEAVADPALAAGVPADRVKASVPFLSVPLSALAPRLKRLEAELKADAPRLFVDLPAAAKAFADRTKSAPQVWNPPGDLFSYPRALAGFTPVADGGTLADPNLPLLFKRSQVPDSLMQAGFAPGLATTPTDLGAPDAVQQLQAVSLGQFAEQFLVDPSPRERTQRGQPEAVRQLVALRDDFLKGQERLRTDRDREAVVREWVGEARERCRKLAAARDRNPAALADAQAAFQKFWQDSRRAWAVLVDVAVTDAGAAEATFLLALVRHEQAEREQVKVARQPTADGRRTAADAWAEARGWWARYEPFADAQDKAFPGRAAHARRLAAEAAGKGG